MSLTTLMRTAYCCLLAAVVFLGGCASSKSFDQHISQWQGKPLSELKQEMWRPGSYASQIRWKEQTWPLNNGNVIYVEPFDPTCTIKWEVTPGGNIVSHTATGAGCGDEDFLAPPKTEPLQYR